MFVTEGHLYLGERILKVRIGLLWLLLLVGTLLTSADPLTRLPWLAMTSALFVLAFRLWDDLADMEYDRQHHPRRGLVRSAEVRSFHAAQWFLITALGILVLTITDGVRALAFLGLVAFYLAMYRVTGNRPGLRPLRVSLVLVKYPTFVLLLALHPDDPVALLAALGVYLLPLLDEVRSTGPAILLASSAIVGLAILAWLGLAT